MKNVHRGKVRYDRILFAALLLFLAAYCLGGGTGQDALKPWFVGWSFKPRAGSPEAAVRSLHSGMSEQEVRAALQGITLDSGTVYLGGTGARILYFALLQSRQVWVHCAGPRGGWKVTDVGRIKPKGRWVRYNGDSITVE
jgi:hypothetical protein